MLIMLKYLYSKCLYFCVEKYKTTEYSNQDFIKNNMNFTTAPFPIPKCQKTHFYSWYFSYAREINHDYDDRGYNVLSAFLATNAACLHIPDWPSYETCWWICGASTSPRHQLDITWRRPCKPSRSNITWRMPSRSNMWLPAWRSVNTNVSQSQFARLNRLIEGPVSRGCSKASFCASIFATVS